MVLEPTICVYFVCIPGAPKIVPHFKYTLILHAQNNGNVGFDGVLRETAPNPLFPLFSACRMSTYLKGGTILGAPGIHTNTHLNRSEISNNTENDVS